MQALCLFANSVGCEQILAVGNDTHIYKNWRYNKKKSSKMMSDYDSFWLSIGAETTQEGYFRLPLTIARKSLEEIASKNGQNIVAVTSCWTIWNPQLTRH